MGKKDNEGRTPFDIAKMNKHDECVKLIQPAPVQEVETLNKDKDPKSEESTLHVPVEVHQIEAQNEGEETTDALLPESKQQNNTESSVGEKEGIIVAPIPKRERKVSFFLEDEATNEKTENDDVKLPDDVLVDSENEEADKEEIQNSESTVSILITCMIVSILRYCVLFQTPSNQITLIPSQDSGREAATNSDEDLADVCINITFDNYSYVVISIASFITLDTSDKT